MSVKGRVLTNTDKKPIAGAHIEMIERDVNAITDKNGFFQIEEQTGFCYEPALKITAEHYKPFEILFKHSEGIKSFHIKSEAEFIDYEKPLYPFPKNKNTVIYGTWIDMFSENFAIQGDTILVYLDISNNKTNIEKNNK
jgi:hypothetical protein